MKVTFLLTQSLESPGGSGRFLPLAQALAALGHHITILALHHDYANAPEKTFTRDGVRVRYLGQMHVRKVGSQKFYFNTPQLLWITFLATLRLSWAAVRTPADALYIGKSQPMNGLAAWVAHRLKHIPVLLDSDDYEAGNNRFSASWQQKLVARFENWLPSFASAVLVGNHFIGRHFQTVGVPAHKIHLLPNGVSRSQFALLDTAAAANRLAHLRQSLPFPPSARLIVYIGSISLVSHPIDLLLHAFARVRQREPLAALLLVGGGEDIEPMRALAARLGLADWVHFHGRVPAADIPAYYRLGELSVDPRRAGVAAESSLSLKLVESIAAAVPCVTTDIGDRKEIGGAACVAVPPDDAAALAKAITCLLADSAARDRLKTAALTVRETLFWDGRARLLDTLLRQAAPHAEAA